MTRTRPARVDDRSRRASRAFSALNGVVALAVLLQALWAGIVLQHDGRREQAGTWIGVHAAGGEVAVVLAAVSAGYAFVTLRHRRDLWVGSVVLTALLGLETYLGAAIRAGHPSLTVVHLPLAMALMALVVWLPLRARTG